MKRPAPLAAAPARLLPGAVAALSVIGGSASADGVSSDCTFEGHQLYGDIEIVTSFPDVKVEIVTSFPDLKVQMVDSFPDSCGKWRIVDSFPDTKVQFVTSFPDVKIEYVSSFPGLP